MVRMRKVSLTTGEIYHICNRSTEGKHIFESSHDAERFLKTLYDYNTTHEGLRGARRHPNKSASVKGSPLVEVYATTIMPNHFHILVRQLVDGGITKWMQRSCNSFSHAYNLVHDRKGTLFMGRFQAVPVLDDHQLFHLLVYIHSNPLDLCVPHWRSGGVENWAKAKSFLANYRWSSLGVYEKGFTADNLFTHLVTTDSLHGFIFDRGGLENGIRNWSERSLEEIQNLILED